VSATSCARRRLIRNVRLINLADYRVPVRHSGFDGIENHQARFPHRCVCRAAMGAAQTFQCVHQSDHFAQHVDKFLDSIRHLVLHKLPIGISDDLAHARKGEQVADGQSAFCGFFNGFRYHKVVWLRVSFGSTAAIASAFAKILQIAI